MDDDRRKRRRRIGPGRTLLGFLVFYVVGLGALALAHFRLVLVLDEVFEELAALVGYLESVTEGLLVDLVAVSAYEVGGSQVVVPQRVDAAAAGNRGFPVRLRRPSPKAA